MRKKLYDIVEKSDGNNLASLIYDYLMLVVIIVSIIPLAFKTETSLLFAIDKACLAIFIVDYIFRFATADYRYSKGGIAAFLRYPFSLMAIIDLVSILPSVTAVNAGFKLLRLVRISRALRVFRVFKALRYSKSMMIIVRVLQDTKDSLTVVCLFAIGYIFISALVVFNVEPDSFNTFFDAIYWATVSLTTVGYGDIYPVTTVGRAVTMVSSVFGIAIVALPAGIITAGYMREIEKTESE